ncbi:hypothetical protein NFI96_029690, partial [Prochilodus magdalenae]
YGYVTFSTAADLVPKFESGAGPTTHFQTDPSLRAFASAEVMKSCSSALCVLILLITTFTPGFESCFSSVKVKFKETATLPCSERCSGVVRWTASSKPDGVLAECDQTSCRSVKEGYQMIHNQYLKGNFSLIITAADYSKTERYTSKCDDRDIGDVDLQVVALNTTLQIDPGKTLVLEIDISDPVEVLYTSADGAGPSRVQICTVNGDSLQCKPEYENRAILNSGPPSVLELRRMIPSDSGVYWIVDKQNEKDIHIYTVIVKTRGPLRDPGLPVWGIIVIALVVTAFVVGSVMKSCSSAVCVLVLLIATGTSCTVTTPCYLHSLYWYRTGSTGSFSGQLSPLKPTEVLAECNQTSCRSVKEGYQMIHHQHLKGSFSLTFTAAEFHTKSWFTSKCDDSDLYKRDGGVEEREQNVKEAEKQMAEISVPFSHADPVKKPPPYEKEVRFEEVYPQLPVISPEGTIHIRDEGGCWPKRKREEIKQGGKRTKETTALMKVIMETMMEIRKVSVLCPQEGFFLRPSTRIEEDRRRAIREVERSIDQCLSYLDKSTSSESRKALENQLKELKIQERDKEREKEKEREREMQIEGSQKLDIKYDIVKRTLPEATKVSHEVLQLCSLHPGPTDHYLHFREVCVELTLHWLYVFAVFSLSGTELQKCPSPVKVKFKETATLTCSDSCSDVVKWTMSSKPTEVLAECNQTSCRSVKEGYQMNRDQYLKGDPSLTITAADYNKTGWYTFWCNKLDIGRVDLQVVAVLCVSNNEEEPFNGDMRQLEFWGTVFQLISLQYIGQEPNPVSHEVLQLCCLCPGPTDHYRYVLHCHYSMLPSQLILVPDRFYWVLFSLSGSESCFTSVRVKLHDSATLPCAGTCSGVAKWTVYHNPTEVLAECDQTSCRSVKEGYQMNRDQYLKSNFSLTITKADYSTKTWFMCKCDDRNICEADVQTYPLRTTLKIEAGEPLVLGINISDPVEVLYTSTDGAAPSRVQICTVNGGSLQCNPEYEHRANLISIHPSVLELRLMIPSDSGVYSIVDKQSGEDINIYTVTVEITPKAHKFTFVHAALGPQGAALKIDGEFDVETSVSRVTLLVSEEYE